MLWLALLACTGTIDDPLEDSGASTEDSGSPVDDSGVTDTDDPPDSEDTSDTEDTTPTSCPRAAASPNRTRYVVAGRPYDDNGGQSNRWEVLELSTAGALSRPNTIFQMGRAFLGEVVFTPDGEVGLVAQDDGTIGVFTLDNAGQPTVVHAAYDGGGVLYAGGIAVEPGGETALVLDGNWPNNGGGIFRVVIGCDGRLGAPTKLLESKLAKSITLSKDGSSAFVAAKELDGVEGTGWLFDPATGGATAGESIFPDDEWILSHGTWTDDGTLGLVADASLFTTHRVGVFSISGGGLSATEVISPFNDPMQLVASPFNDAVLVVEGMGDAVKVLKRTGDTNNPVQLTGEPTYVGAHPQLPSGATRVAVGDLKGTVLIGELSGIRTMTFDGSGGIVDGGLFETGQGIVDSIGAIGVQP